MLPRVGNLLKIILFVPCLVGLSRSVHATQVACSSVISAINREIRVNHGQTPDISVVAKQLRTSPIWVEHCMRVYGRRPRRPGLENAEGREGRLEQYEDREPEEAGLEDIEEPAEERREPAPKQRGIRPKRTPTPGGFREGF